MVAGQRGEHLPRAAGGEQFGDVVGLASGGEDGQPVDVSADHEWVRIAIRVGDGIDQARPGFETEDRQDLRLGEVPVDEQSLDVALAGQRQSEVQRAESLTLVGLSRADQDRLTLVIGDRAVAADVQEQLTLDDAKLLGKGADGASGRM
jgi:hypothetical protein